MNAAEARKRRVGSTLVERTRRDPARAARIDMLVTEASVEQALQHIMEIEDVSAAELGRRVKSKAPQISRDLHGGLSKARISRIIVLARALGYDFVPMFVPHDAPRKRRIIIDFCREALESERKSMRGDHNEATL
jgi:hypothetical protein